ncbi:MAG: tetratricopeptide repeat protein [Candidatus Aenigmarchaeota archaeon]|nr:tetratricopeptide repeat protein [Candidatus Aenigmarchaeota archaeon]
MSEIRYSLDELLDDFKAYFEAGKRLERSNNGYQDAIALYEKADNISQEAVRLYPNSAHSHYYRGIILEKLKNPNEAHYHFSRAIAKNSRDAAFFLKRGDVSTMLGNFQDAVKDYKESLKVSFRYSKERLIRRGIRIVVPVSQDPNLFKDVSIEATDNSWWYIPID